MNMAKATLKNWEAAFSLSDTARQRVLCTSRFRHRSSSIAPQAISPPLRPSQPSMLNTANSTRTQKPDDDDDDDINPDDGVPNPFSLKKKPNRRAGNSSNKTSSDDNAEGDVPCSVKPSLPKKKRKSTPSPTISSSKGGENVDYNDCTITPIPKHARLKTATLSSHKSQHKRAKVCVETSIETVVSFDDQTAIRLQADFFQCDALELAPKLLGKFLRRDEVVLQITEVEAYRPNDSACHGRFGVTPRTAPVFGPGGHVYVYLCYGLHIMLNIVADIKGVGAAVLIRSCAPVAGLQTIQSRRGISTNKPILLTGPGKVGQALGLTTDWSHHPLYTAGGLEVLDGPSPEKILVGPRIGVDYANPEDVAALWRFAVYGTPWISAPRNTLAPPHL